MAILSNGLLEAVVDIMAVSRLSLWRACCAVGPLPCLVPSIVMVGVENVDFLLHILEVAEEDHVDNARAED